MRYLKLALVIAGIMKLVKCQVLQSDVKEDELIYPGQNLTFRCEVKPPIIAWASDEFIGPGGAQLEFASSQPVGTMQNSTTYPSTYAVLLVNGTQLVSELHIVTSSSHQSASVYCINGDTGNRTSYSFVVDEIPRPVVDCTLSQDRVACPDEQLSFYCEAIDSEIVAWKSDEYVGTNGEEIQFSIHEHPGTIKQSTQNPDAIAMLLNTLYVRGIPILQCQLNITVSATIMQYGHSITCLNAAVGTSNIYSFRKNNTCGLTTKQDEVPVTTSMEFVDEGTSDSSTVQGILSIVISALIVILAYFG